VLAATGQLGMAAAVQIRLAGVINRQRPTKAPAADQPPRRERPDAMPRSLRAS
jgi:hypothetical protein